MMATSTFVAGEHSTPIADLSFAPVLPTEALGLRLREDLLDTWVAVTEAASLSGSPLCHKLERRRWRTRTHSSAWLEAFAEGPRRVPTEP